MSKIIDGKKISEIILEETKEIVEGLNLKPKLAIILASDDESSKIYVNIKKKRAEEIGIEVEVFEFNENSEIADIVYKISELNNDSKVKGILLQLPLHDHLKEKTNLIMNAIQYNKDVDGLTAIQQGLVSQGMQQSIPPAAVEAVVECMNNVLNEKIDWKKIKEQKLKGKKIVIVNNSDLLGKPLSMILSNLGATVTIANKYTDNLGEHTLSADIIVSGTGQGEIISADIVKENAILIDVTSLKTTEGIVGDFILDEEMKNKVSTYTPVPGGVGPITVACLLRNVAKTK